MLHAVMVGTAESYLGAFAVDLGHGDTALSMLATLPLLLFAVVQLLAAPIVQRFGSRRLATVSGATLQGLSLFWLMHIAITKNPSFLVLLTAKALFWTSGGIIAPIWNAWIGALTRGVDREHFFAVRSLAIHCVLLIAFLIAGIVLEQRENGYPLLFCAAGAARLLSAAALSRKRDVPPPAAGAERTTLSQLRKALTLGQFRTARFVGLLMFGAHISVPFFTPYMLRVLHLSKLQFALLTAISILGKALSFPLWRFIATRQGMGPILAPSTALVALMPWAWTLTADVMSLAALQLVSGIAWAGFEFATLQLFLRESPLEADVEFFALSNSLVGCMQLGGSLLGSALLRAAPIDYYTVFNISSAVRGLALLLLASGVWRVPLQGPVRTIFTRILTVRPGAGALLRAIRLDPPRVQEQHPPTVQEKEDPSRE